MAVYLGVPLKKTSEVDLIKPLTHVISAYYSTADEQCSCAAALTELNKLRMNATWRTLDKHESSLDIMYRYYDQLTSLETKCPPSDIQIPFKWKDAFDKGGIFSGSMSLSRHHLAVPLKLAFESVPSPAMAPYEVIISKGATTTLGPVQNEEAFTKE